MSRRGRQVFMSRDSSAKRNEQILADLLKEDSNRQCADCGQKGTRWASWNIGVFLCIRCGGLHRKLGTHISRVKSVTLDSWTDEEIQSIRTKGNAKVNALYNPDPNRFPFPAYSGDMEQYIRDKYERKLFQTASPRSSSAPMNLGRKSFGEVSRTESSFSNEVGQLYDMGFKDRGLALKALQSSKGNISDAIDNLSNFPKPTSPSFKETRVDLIDDFSSLNLTPALPKPKQVSGQNDWTDFDFDNTAAADEPKVHQPVQAPTAEPIKTEPPASPAEELWGASPKVTTTTTTNLGSVLGSARLFDDDDDNDPFKELTHNPFK